MTAPKCPVCESENCVPWTSRTWKIAAFPKEFSYLECNGCHSIFCNPWPTAAELTEFYGKHFDYNWYERRLIVKKIQAHHRWQRMQSLFKKFQITRGALLDIGCGHGMFVNASANDGWDATGIDFPSKATRHAENVLRLKIVEDELISACQSGKLAGSQFDFITAWHCLEHSANPAEYLACAATLLKPGGKLLVAVPNAESYGMKFAREDWLWCQEPFVHLVHFNSASLSRLAGRARLKPVSTWSRDTWDANRACDTSRLSGIIWKHFTRRVRISPQIDVVAHEGHRLFFYFFGCPNHWLLGRECREMDGSELLLLAERAA